MESDLIEEKSLEQVRRDDALALAYLLFDIYKDHKKREIKCGE